MSTSFSIPQRQSLVGVLVMFTDTLQKSVRALFPLLIVILAKGEKLNKFYIWPAVITLFLLIALIAYLKYRNFTYHLDEQNEEFVINSGVFNKSRLAIPLDKIQQVNINQSLIQKIVGVHALEVDTAGSGRKEVSIRAINHTTATELKARLLEGSRNAVVQEATGEPVAEGSRPFITISLASLFKTGITSNYARSFALLLAFVITAFQYIEDFIKYAEIDDDPLDDYITAEMLLKFLGFIVAAVIVLTLVINLIRTIIKYFNFRITRQQNSLLLSYGLLNTKNTIIRPEKVQIVTIGRNYFQKKLDILDIKIRQASGSGTEADPENKKSAIEIPGCSRNEKDVLMQFLLDEIPQKGAVVKPNIRKLIVECVVWIIIPLLIYFGIAQFIYAGLYDYILFVPVYVLFTGLLVCFAFRNSRLFVNDNFIIKQSGAWDIDTDYVAPHKIQAVSVQQFFWQKSSDVGMVTLHTAGGNISFGVARFTKLKELVNYWLYSVETTAKHWM